MSDLPELQNWLQTAITDPHSVDPAAVDSAVAGGRLAALDRLGIYQRAHDLRLLQCLRAEYAVLCDVLENEVFNELALDYLRRNPPNTYTLFQLGARFPDYIADTRPDHGDCQPELVFDFMQELATLERAFVEVARGPGHEDTESSKADCPLQGRLENAQVTPAVCLRLLHSQFALPDFFLALRRGEKRDTPGRDTTWIAMTRRHWQVQIHSIERWEWQLLQCLLNGQSLNQSAQHVARELNLDEIEVRSRLPVWLSHASDQWLLHSVTFPDVV